MAKEKQEKKAVKFALYCTCGVYLELTAWPVMYSADQLKEMFDKHSKTGCLGCGKEAWRAEKEKRAEAARRKKKAAELKP